MSIAETKSIHRSARNNLLNPEPHKHYSTLTKKPITDKNPVLKFYILLMTNLKRTMSSYIIMALGSGVGKCGSGRGKKRKRISKRRYCPPPTYGKKSDHLFSNSSECQAVIKIIYFSYQYNYIVAGGETENGFESIYNSEVVKSNTNPVSKRFLWNCFYLIYRVLSR